MQHFLSNKQLAELYECLFRLYDAGLAPGRLFASVAASFRNPRLISSLQRASTLVASGRSMAGALRLAGLANQRDIRLLESGESSGGVDRVLHALGAYYLARARRVDRFRAQMAYPVAILVLAIFIAPVVDLFTGAISPGGYLLRTVLPLALGYAVYSLIKQLSRRRGHGQSLLVLGFAVPIARGLLLERVRVDFLLATGLALTCGMPAMEALGQAIDAVPGPLRRRYQTLATCLKNGLGAAESLRKAEVVDAGGYAVLSSAEAAGRFDDALKGHADQLSSALDERLDTTTTWLARGAYLLVLVILGAGLLV